MSEVTIVGGGHIIKAVTLANFSLRPSRAKKGLTFCQSQ